MRGGASHNDDHPNLPDSGAGVIADGRVLPISCSHEHRQVGHHDKGLGGRTTTTIEGEGAHSEPAPAVRHWSYDHPRTTGCDPRFRGATGIATTPIDGGSGGHPVSIRVFGEAGHSRWRRVRGWRTGPRGGRVRRWKGGRLDGFDGSARRCGRAPAATAPRGSTTGRRRQPPTGVAAFRDRRAGDAGVGRHQAPPRAGGWGGVAQQFGPGAAGATLAGAPRFARAGGAKLKYAGNERAALGSVRGRKSDASLGVVWLQQIFGGAWSSNRYPAMTKT